MKAEDPFQGTTEKVESIENIMLELEFPQLKTR